MSQHDFDIANQTFPSFRSDLNDALQAAATMSAGSSAPTTPYAYQLWFDTTTSTWKVRNSGNTAWISTITTDLATGNVGVGTSSPSVELEIASSAPQMRITDTDTNAVFQINASSTTGGVELQADATGVGSNPFMAFDVAGTEAARFDSNQNLLVGKTSTTNSVAGVELNSTGQLVATVDSATHILGRNTSNGSILQFDRAGVTIGSIHVTTNAVSLQAASGKYLTINSYASGYLEFLNSSYTGTPRVRPDTDNYVDLGDSSRRFDDIYATNGTIQTSDANEKQQIAALTDAEIAAAKAISALFKTFKWNDAVAEKGDAARTHAGVIAQDVEAAMTAAGLDAGDYAFFISSTWWETQTEVPAVEAVDAVLDEDGNVVTEGVEAVAAYTRTDTYDTAEEAPEGATKRTRLGVRYPELLAFIGAATEQRLSNIETRLAVLENA